MCLLVPNRNSFVPINNQSNYEKKLNTLITTIEIIEVFKLVKNPI